MLDETQKNVRSLIKFEKKMLKMVCEPTLENEKWRIKKKRILQTVQELRYFGYNKGQKVEEGLYFKKRGRQDDEKYVEK